MGQLRAAHSVLVPLVTVFALSLSYAVDCLIGRLLSHLPLAEEVCRRGSDFPCIVWRAGVSRGSARSLSSPLKRTGLRRKAVSARARRITALWFA